MSKSADYRCWKVGVGKWVFVAKRWEEMRKVRLIMYPISNETRGVSA